MDFDYHKIEDAESQRREERLCRLPVHLPNVKSRPPCASETQLTGQKPPVKPRRSIKCRPAAQHGTEQLTNQQKDNEVRVKRIAPALVLGPLGTLESLTPSLHAHTLLWFERTQLPRLRTPGQPLPRWLHGFATRSDAEQLLQDKPHGCFLLRLSESKIGFVLSYRGQDRCRHFIIEEEDSGTFGSVYVIAGENSRHRSLEDLINYYTHNPVRPFNEKLTVPCMQSNAGDIERLGLKNQEEGKENVNESSRDEQIKLPVAAGPAVQDAVPTNSNPTTLTSGESAQYAAVRKPLRKTYSLPESKCVPDTAPPAVQNGSRELAERSSNLNVTGNQTRPAEAPYARVNKPPRAVSANTAAARCDLQGATAAVTPPALPSFDASAAEEKYCKLEPMHTYEETRVHTRMRDEEIGCRAAGRQTTGEAVELPAHHLYSEVNIRGVQEHPAVSGLTPSLPLRPPPRSAHAPLRPESTGQPRHSASHHSEQPHLEASCSSIYEQIPVRPTSSRPALPPPHLKR